MEVTCEHCGKAYRVADRLAGKKANCKHCGKLFLLQGRLDTAADIGLQADDPIIGLQDDDEPAPPPRRPATKPPAKATPPSKTPRRAPARSTRDDDPIPDLAPLPSPPRAGASCPSCGGPMAADAALCLNCGFNRQHGAITQTQVETPIIVQAPPRTRDTSQRDALKVRINTQYENPLLAFPEIWAPTVILWLSGISFVWNFLDLPIRIIRNHLDVPAKFWPLWVLFFFFIFISIVIVLWFCSIGVSLAGATLRFHLPENPFRRAFACLVLNAIALRFVFIAILFSTVIMLQRTNSLEPPALVLMATMEHYVRELSIAALAVVLLVDYALMYPLVLYFYRLKPVEALLATGLFILFFFIGVAAVGYLAYGVIYCYVNYF